MAGERAQRRRRRSSPTIVASAASLLAPVIIGRTVDATSATAISPACCDRRRSCWSSTSPGWSPPTCRRSRWARVGRRVLFNLRNALFTKLQAAAARLLQPEQGRRPDLAHQQRHRQAQSVLLPGAGAARRQHVPDDRRGDLSADAQPPARRCAALAPAAGVLVVTRATAGWVKRQNIASLQALGGLSGEIQESLEQLQGDRRVQPRRLFPRAVQRGQRSATTPRRSAPASPTTSSCRSTASPSTWRSSIVLAYGFYLIAAGSFTVGLLIGFLLYVNSFYMPLRQLAAVWSSFQLALAEPRSHFRGARARAEHAAAAGRRRRRGTAPARCSHSTTCSSAIRGGQDGAARRDVHARARARPTRWSARPAAARRRPRR